MKLTLVRHGETEENKHGIIQGQKPGSLSSLGKRQVENVAKKLKNEHYDAIYSSDLKRCIDTVNPIHRYHKNTALIYSKDLRELSFGKMEGLPVFLATFGRRVGSLLNIKAPGGESWKDLNTRVKNFLNELYQKHSRDNILIVTHGGPIRSVQQQLEGRSRAEVMKEDVANCSVNKFTMNKFL